MKKLIGIVLIVLGALLLIFSYFQGDLVDMNWFTITSFLLIIVGIIAHINLTKSQK